MVPSVTLAIWGWHAIERTNLDQLFGDLAGSLLFAGATCLMTMVCGGLLAMAHAAPQTMGVTRLLIVLANVGFFLPSTVVAVGMLQLGAGAPQSAMGRILFGSWTALLGAGLFRNFFYGFGSVRIALKRSPPQLFDTAQAYFPSWWQRFLGVYAPTVRPWFALGAVFAFISAFKELNLVQALAPYNFTTLATRIYYSATYGTVHECALWGLAMALVAMYPLIAVAGAITGESPPAA